MNAGPLSRLSKSAVSIVLAMLVLAACVEVQMESEYNEDGSARHAFETTIDREGFDQLAALGGEGEGEFSFSPEDGREQAEAAGFDYTPIETDDKVGSRIAKTFEDGEQVGMAFDEMFAANTDEGTDVPLGAVTGTFVQDGNEYRLNLTINSDILFVDSGAAEGVEDTGFGDLSDFVDITYIATMPGEISETNGTDLGNGKVEWELPLSGTTEISAVSTTGGNGGSGGLIAILGLVALLLIGGLVAGYLFTRRRTPAVATAGSTDTTYTTQPTGSPAYETMGTNPNVSTSSDTVQTDPSGSSSVPTDADDDRPSHEQDTRRLP